MSSPPPSPTSVTRGLYEPPSPPPSPVVRRRVPQYRSIIDLTVDEPTIREVGMPVSAYPQPIQHYTTQAELRSMQPSKH